MANLKMDGSFPEEKLNREKATKELDSVDWLPADLELIEKIRHRIDKIFRLK